MPRPIWNGAISFGLVNVPVKLFSAVSRKDIRFHQLHDADGVRIKQKRVCPADGEEVAYEHIVKGYEIEPEQYVLIEPEELDALDPQSTHTIDIEEFVQLSEIDPVFYESTYYLAPDANSQKAYALLVEAMTKAGRVGIGRFVLRTKQYLAAVRPKDGHLVLSTMLFADEVNEAADIESMPDATDVSDKELAMAQQLIDALSTEFDASKFKDNYREQVMELIERKAAGQEIVAQPAVEEPARVVDLMAALERSLQEAKNKRQSA